MSHSPNLPGPAILFCPADRPDRYEKALLAGDAVVFDLEDAVSPDQKDTARTTLAEFLKTKALTDVFVRVNPVTTPWFAKDVKALQSTGVRIMLPKAESPQTLAELSDFEVLAICETPLGAVNAYELAKVDNTWALLWGGEDMTAALAGRATRRPDGSYMASVNYLRAHVLIAAGAAQKAAIDGAYLDIPDLAGLAAETSEGVGMGFKAKIAIHPSQVAVIRKNFAPSAEDLEWATAVIEASKSEHGVFNFRGRMIDAPLLAQAQAYVAAAPDIGG